MFLNAQNVSIGRRVSDYMWASFAFCLCSFRKSKNGVVGKKEKERHTEAIMLVRMSEIRGKKKGGRGKKREKGKRQTEAIML
jgi:hypothetical protein